MACASGKAHKYCGALTCLCKCHKKRTKAANKPIFRPHEDAVEIACCLFSKGMLSGETIDDAAGEIEKWLRAAPSPV
jgi:hypothetical protein